MQFRGVVAAFLAIFIGVLPGCRFVPDLHLAQAVAPSGATPSPAAGPRVYGIRPSDLLLVKERARAGDSRIAPALTKLRLDANAALHAGPFSVVEKTVLPPGGDKHDYYSLSRYWWPDPNSPNGLPYVNRDGQTNPEINTIPDKASLDKMVSAVEALALEYYLEGDAKYADRAAVLLRAWFLDEATRMNPNLNAAQVVRGRNTGSTGGIIDGRGFARIVDSVGLLAGSRAWSDADQTAMRQWFTRYLEWLTTSNAGKAEARATNNHGIWYDVQAASIAFFVGDRDLALRLLQTTRDKRIPDQIEPDGRQPAELARATSWDYSVFNLEAFTLAAALAENVDLGIWDFQTADGRGIRKAFDYLLPYGLNEQPWPDKQIAARDRTMTFIAFRRASAHYGDNRYRQASETVSGVVSAASRENLLYPER